MKKHRPNSWHSEPFVNTKESKTEAALTFQFKQSPNSSFEKVNPMKFRNDYYKYLVREVKKFEDMCCLENPNKKLKDRN